MDDDTELLERRSRDIAQEMGVLFSPKSSLLADLSPRLYASPAKHVTPMSSIPSPLSPLRTLDFDEYIDQTGQISNISLSAPLAGFVDPQIAQLSELHADQIPRAVAKFGEQQRRINVLTKELAQLRACDTTSKAFGKDHSRDDDMVDLQLENKRLQHQVSKLQQDLNDLGEEKVTFQDRGEDFQRLERQFFEQESEMAKLQRDMDHQTCQYKKQQEELHKLREKCASQEHRLAHSDLKLQSTQQEVHQLRASRTDNELDWGRMLAKDKEIAELKLAREQYVVKLDKSEQLRRATQRLLRKYYDLYHDLAAQAETTLTAKEKRVIELERELAGAIAKLADLDSKYKSAMGATSEHQREIDTLMSQLRTKSQQLSREREALAHKDVLHDAVRQELADLKRRSHDFNDLIAELEKAKLMARDSNKVADDLKHARQQNEELQSLVAEMLELKSHSSKLQGEIDSIRAEMTCAQQELERLRSQLGDKKRDLEISQGRTRTVEQALESMTKERDLHLSAIARLELDLEARNQTIRRLQETLTLKDEELKSMREKINQLEHATWQAESDRDSSLARTRELGTQLDLVVKTNESREHANREITTNLEQQIKAYQETTYALEQEHQALKNELQELQRYKRAAAEESQDGPAAALTPPRDDHEFGNGLNQLQSTIVDDEAKDDAYVDRPMTAEHRPESRQIHIPVKGNTRLAPPAPEPVGLANGSAGGNENMEPAKLGCETHQARIALDVYVSSEPTHNNEPNRPSLEPQQQNGIRTTCTPAASITRGNNAEYELLW